MEQQPSNEPLFGLQVDYDSGSMFSEAGKWAKFLSIIGFIGIGICLLVLAFSSTVLLYGLNTVMPGLEIAGGLLIGVIAIVLIFFAFLTFLLYRFATLVRQGVEQHNQVIFNDGIRSLKNYFLINGIVSLIGIVINVVGTIGNLF